MKLPNGKEVKEVKVDVIQSNENWNTYLLDDGTVLKIKLVVTDILRADGEVDHEGNPLYLIKSTNVVAVSKK